MPLSLDVPDNTEVSRLLRESVVKDDYRVTLTDIAFLKKTENNNHIFKAKMSGQDVIVKFAYEDMDDIAIPRLKYESQIYVDYLKPLWGVHVPQFYGFYLYNPSDPDELSCACIVLQYCGEPAVSDLSQLKDYRGHEYGLKRFRNDTMDAVFSLHSPNIGLVHDALDAPQHILDFEGYPFIIDFAGAEPRECLACKHGELTRDVLPAQEGEILQPLGSDSVMCYELWMFLQSIEYCLPYAVEFYRRMYLCDSITSAGDFYEEGLIKWPRFMSDQEMWDESVKQWKRIHSNWKKYHPDAVVEPPLGIIDLEEYQKTHPSRPSWINPNPRR